MTNKDKIQLANKLIKEVIIDNHKNEINEFNKSILWVCQLFLQMKME